MAKTQLLDVLERAAWTLLEGASAVGLIAAYQALDFPDLEPATIGVILPVVAAVLAAIKGQLATKFGNGTASTLPAELEPLPAPEEVLG